MVMRVVVLVLCLVAACRFDERAFGERFCTGDQDCARPDQSCIEHTCTQRACVTDIDCGADYAYACTAGGCVVRTCAGVAECALGFACSDGMCRSSFNVASVVSTSNASIAVTFDAPPDEAAAKALGNYAVSGLTITGATEIAGNTVVLATSPQTEQSYTLGVTGITRAGDHAPLSAATATFTGRTAFAVTSVIATSSISLLVTFSAPPDPTASALASYAIPGLVVGGTPVLAGNTVALATSPQRATGYTLTVAGVRRASDGEALTSAIAPFTGRDDFNVVRTRAVTSRSIEIEFDAPPNAAQATSLASYSVPGLTLSGVPLVDGTLVTLGTSTQLPASYTLTVSGVTRATDGEPLTVAAGSFTGIVPFHLVSATATTTATVVLTFDAPPDPMLAALPTSYDIPGLTLGGAPVVAGNTVTLTTSPQLATSYTVSVGDVRRASDGEPLGHASVSFTGRIPFDVTGAIATASQQVLVTFDAPPNQAQAMNLASYNIPGLTLSGTPVVSGSTVTLSTSPQSAASFTLTATGVTRASDGEPLTSATASFVGCAPFGVTSAIATSATTVAVTFDNPPNAAHATTLGNYSVGGLALVGAPQLAGNTVVLTTSPQTATTYAVVVANVRRASDAEPLTVASASFTGRAPFRVASAASASNTSLTVTFDAPPHAAQATTLARYSVPGLVLSGTPALTGNTVTISTSAQLVQSYTVDVNGVMRASDGEQLAVTSATFTGRTGFNVTSATSVSSTAIAVTFDAAPTPMQATTLASYSVPGLVLSGTPVLNGNTVTLSTSQQAAQTYTVTVTGVTRASDASPLQVSTASFSHTSFNVASAASLSSRSLRVTFDAAPNAAQATSLASYSVGGLTLSGTPVLAGNTVTLTTSAQSAMTYTISVTGITRAADGTVLTTAAAAFTGRAPFEVASAASTSNGSITVTFSAPPTASEATTLASYSVPGLVLSGTPVLSGNIVTLSTSAQTAQTHTVMVSGVTRAADSEPLSSATASFTGTPIKAPTVTNVVVQATTPSNGTTFYNTGTATIVITGTDFASVSCPAGVELDDANGAGVVVATTPTSCTVDSGTQITARFPAGLRTNGALGWNVRVTNSVGTNATSAVKLVPRAGLLISEVMVGGNGVSDDREFIELYNPTAHPLDVAMLGLQLHVRSFNGTDTTLPLAFSTSTIPSHGFLLLVSSTSNASDLWFARRNATYATSTAQLASNGGAYISLSAVPDGKVLDKLGWGLQSAPGFEGTPVSNITANTSAQRKPASGAGAAFDTDTNSTDFLTPSTSITPKGAADPLEP